MRSRKRLLTLTSFLVAALVAQVAEAQQKAGGPPTSAKSSSQFTLRREEAGGPDASAARGRARAGDCAGALPAFDSAIRNTIEPTLRRDRGLCHEKLGNPFPAIDDYRAYLTLRPDAPDADQIRDRLSKVEESVGVGAPSSQAVRNRDDSSGFKAGGQFSLGTEVGSSGGSSSKKSSSDKNEALGPRQGEEGRSYDYYAQKEKQADVADSSPLRFGTGWIFGPFLTLPRFFVGEGASKDLGYSVGAAIRYSFSPSLTFISELGYAGVGESGQLTTSNGPLVLAGLELRIPLDSFQDNSLLLGFGLAFERLTVSGTRQGNNDYEGRFRFGYRHVFASAVGLEICLDGGPVYHVPTGGGVAVSSGSSRSDAKLQGVIGASYALVIGF